MTDIPQDIMDAASNAWPCPPHETFSLTEAIAKAIMAEREHTAELLKDPAAVRINYLRGDIACQHLIAEAVEAERQQSETVADKMYLTGVADAEAWARKWGHHDFADRLVEEVNVRAKASGLPPMRATP